MDTNAQLLYELTVIPGGPSWRPGDLCATYPAVVNTISGAGSGVLSG